MCVNRARVFFGTLKRAVALVGLSSFVLLQACGGGGGGTPATPAPPATQTITGGGVKGPLAQAIVTAYVADYTNTVNFKGAIAGTGTTNAAAKITGLALTIPLNSVYILEFTSDAGTTDITTGVAPVISTLRTVMTTASLTSGEPIYATPLTTMAVDIAIQNADTDGDGTVSEAEFLAALDLAAAQVVSTLGFGLSGSVDIFNTSPLINSTTDTTAEQANVAAYRTAIEALTAVLNELATNSASPAISIEAMLIALTNDLADTGVIDGSVVGGPISATVLSDLGTADPTTLPIPNTDNGSGSPLTASDVEQILVDEKTTTGETTPTPDLEDGTIDTTPTPAVANPSQDGDNIPDSIDNCPAIANDDQADTNANGVGNACEVAPTAVDDDAGSVLEGGTLNGATVLANDSDAEGDTLVPSIVTGPTNAASFTLNADGTFTYVHNGGEIPSDSFTYNVNDGSLNSATAATVSITVTPVDDPTVLGVDTGNVTEDQLVDTATGNVLENDADPDTELSVSNAAALSGVTAYGSLAIASNGAYTYTLDNNNALVSALSSGASLTEIFNYIVNGETTTLTITINGVNDGTILTADSNSIVEDGTNPVMGNVIANDDDPDTTLLVTNAIALTGTGMYGSLAINSAGDYSYTLDNTNATVNALTTDGTLQEAYTYQVNNGPMSSLTITINGNDDASIITADTASITEDDVPSVSGNVLTNDSDPESLVISSVEGASVIYGSITLSADGSFTYTLNNSNATVNALVADETLDDVFEFNVNGIASSLTVTINGVDDVALLTADTNSVVEDSGATATGNVLSNDFDSDSDLSVSNAAALNATGTYGSLAIDATGAYTYTLDNANATVNSLAGGATLNEVYNYTANGVNSSLTITINGVDDAANLAADSAAITEDAANTVTGNVLTNDVDPDSALTLSNAGSLNGTGTYGSLAIDATGAYTYTLDNSNAAVNDLNNGDTLQEVYNYTANGESAALTITINGTTDAAALIDISGVWMLTTTQVLTGACPGPGSDQETYYYGIKQTGTSLAIRTAEGVSLTGTIDPVTGVISNVTGSLDYQEANLADVNNLTLLISNDAFVVSGTATATTMTGDLNYTYTDTNGSVASCIDSTFVGTFVYKHTGAENYSGVYGIEVDGQILDNNGDVDEERTGFPVTMRFDAGNLVAVAALDGASPLNVSNLFFDPDTGFFSFNVAASDSFDNDNDGQIDRTYTDNDAFTGIFINDPATNPGSDGQPVMIFLNSGYSRGLDVPNATYIYAANYDQSGYGKLLNTQATTRTVMLQKGDQDEEARVLMGIAAVPTELATPTSKLYIEVLDNGTSLCTAPFITEGASSGRYFEQINMPNPDFATQQFRSNSYSTVNCNTNEPTTGDIRVTDGFLYTVRIVDTGADGVIGGADDTYPASFEYAARVVPANERFSKTQNVFDIDVNGASVSETMGGSAVPYYGYFDSSETNVITWPAHPDTASQYQLRLQDEDDIAKRRYATNNTSLALAPFSVDDWDAQETTLRLVALKNGTNGAKAMSFTRRIALRNGIWGHWNFEFSTGIGVPRYARAFSIKIETTPNTGGNVLCAVRTSSGKLTCNSATIDYVNDTVTLNLTDSDGRFAGGINTPTPGASLDLILNFKVNGTLNNGQAIVTSNSVAGIGANPLTASAGVALSTNPEFRVRSMRMSNGDIQSSAIIYNPTNVGLLDQGQFRVNDDSNLVIGGVIDTLSKDFNISLQLANFIAMPNDGNNAQRNGRYSRYRTDYDWGGLTGLLAVDRYKLVQTSSSDASLKRVYRADYAAPLTDAYIAPQLGDIEIEAIDFGTTNCVAGGACSSSSPVDVTNGFNVVWTVPTAPVGSFWRLSFSDDTGSGRRQVRTAALESEGGFLSFDFSVFPNADGTTTYTWFNPGEFNVKAGQTWRIQIRLTDKSGFWDVGGFSRNPDQPRVTVPEVPPV